MISANDLTRCIDNLAEINACLGSGNSALKRLVLEIGYILKQELDTVNAWNAQFKDDKRLKGMANIDVKKLIEDNTQLFNENRKLQEINLKLKEVIDERIPRVENAVGTINEKFDTFSQMIDKL